MIAAHGIVGGIDDPVTVVVAGQHAGAGIRIAEYQIRVEGRGDCLL
jgi:hypothetical protein